MQHDDVIWHVINQGHCSYKAKTTTQTFCRHPMNLTGMCNRTSCPLANSQYATIQEEEGRLVLCVKTIERAWSPRRLWERTTLSRNYAEALAQVEEELEHWPQIVVHKCKQRLTKMSQYLMRARRLRLKPKPALERVHKKVEMREARREAKAEKAAQLDKAIEKELLARLKQGTYGGIYNFPMREYESALDQAELAEAEADDDDGGAAFEAAESEDEYEEEREEEYDSDAEAEAAGGGRGGRFFGGGDSDDDEDDDDDGDDDDDDEGEEEGGGGGGGGGGRADGGPARTHGPSARARARPQPPPAGFLAAPSKRRRREIEYEEERESRRETESSRVDDW